MQVSDVMTRSPEVCTPDTDLVYVARMMADRSVGVIPVVQDTESMKPIGIVTDRDIVVRAVAKNQNPDDLCASDVMSTDICCASPNMDLRECLKLMEQHEIRRIPVVDQSGKLCGIVAQKDLADHAPLEISAELLKQVSAAPPQGGAYH